MALERKIRTHNNLNSLYLWSHFQRYSYPSMEDIYTKLVKSSVFPYILISTHLYLLVRDDSRAEISREEQEHAYVLVYEFSGAFMAWHGRYAYASDHKTLDLPSFFVYFSPLLQLCLPLNQQNWPKMAYNLPSKMMLSFMKFTHFSYGYSYIPILYHHEFVYHLIHSLILFYHPCSKCGHLHDTHCGIKIYVNGWYLKNYIYIWKLQCQSFHMVCL